MPKNLLKSLRERVAVSTDCPAAFSQPGDCTDFRQIALSKKELQYIKIRPGDTAIGFSKSKKTYQWPIVKITYAKRQDDISSEDFSGYNHEFYFQTTTTTTLPVIVIASSTADIALVRELSAETISPVVDRQQLLDYKRLVLNYYKTHPLDTFMIEPIPEKFKNLYVNWRTSAKTPQPMPHYGKEFFNYYPKHLKYQMLNELLTIKADNYYPANGHPFTILFLTYDKYKSDVFFIVQDGKIIRHLRGDIDISLKIADLIVFMIASCTPHTDACNDDLIFTDGVYWHKIFLWGM